MHSLDGEMGDGNGGLCPVLRTEKNIDNYLNTIKRNLLSKEDTIEYQRKLIKELKDEAYANTELAKMKVELDEMKEDYYRGFPISKKDAENIKNWKKQHDEKEHNNPGQYHGVSGGGYIYEFVPTAIGTFCSCICDRCRIRAHIEAATADTPVVKKTGYDKSVYNEYIEKHNAEFGFGEMAF